MSSTGEVSTEVSTSDYTGASIKRPSRIPSMENKEVSKDGPPAGTRGEPAIPCANGIPSSTRRVRSDGLCRSSPASGRTINTICGSPENRVANSEHQYGRPCGQKRLPAGLEQAVPRHCPALYRRALKVGMNQRRNKANFPPHRFSAAGGRAYQALCPEGFRL